MALALTVFFYADKGALKASRAGVHMLDGTNSQPYELQQRARFEQLRRELAEQVPAGTRMYPEMPWDLWRQRLVEFGIMNGAVMVADPARAQVRVSVVQDPAAPNGIRLVVKWIR